MLILYAALKFDYNDPRQGFSFEHNNFFDSLLNMGHDILYLDTGTLLRTRGRDHLNQRLVEVVRSERPDIMFTVLFRDELKFEAVQQVSDEDGTLTFNWFCDDHWRFENYSRHWAPRFNWVATTANSALPKYKLLGYEHVIKTQWACNHFQYRPQDLPLIYDASFVGLPHGDRPFVVQAVQDAGVDVRVWGKGWSNGRVAQDEMIRIFNQSRINLNLSNASQPGSFRLSLSGFLARRLARLSLAPSFRSRAMHLLATLERTGGSLPERRHAEQIKGRNFEVPGCGGFLLTGQAENLADYYRPGEEVACFADRADLVRQVRYYLDHEAERARIAAAGHRRTLAEHTYVHRLTAIFERMGLPSPPASALLDAPPRPGNVQEVA